jgi:dipeptidyl aminopeptidase/acylaminoacyl peptidase
MTDSTTLPYGAWPSPITAADLARASRRMSFPAPVGDEVWWTETRPEEGGRQTVLRRAPDGTLGELLPAPWHARTRVHEYGGGSWLAVPHRYGHALVFAHFDDQRLYRLDPGATEPVPLTPEPATPAADRYADLVLRPDGRAVWCVRESYTGGQVVRHLVAVPLDGSGAVGRTSAGSRAEGAPGGSLQELVRDGHFLAYPRLSPDGRALAWLTWEHPRMPWDGTELRVAEVGPDGSVGAPRTVLGGPAESVLQPEWAGPGELYAISDRTGWWNLYRLPAGGGEPTALCPREEEFGGPLWQLGTGFYAPLDDGRLAVLHGTDRWRVGVLDPGTGALADLDLPYTTFGGLAGDGRCVATVAGAPDRPVELVLLEPASGTSRVLRRTTDEQPDPAYLPAPEPVTLPGPDGREVHATVYRPASPDVSAPAGELPPYVVFAHGGPTGHSPPALDLQKAYFTSRGIGVLDVNYGGSTGYGRAYRERLRGQWGVVDVQDTVAAALALAERGEADPARLAIRGGSAGGWTTLAALVGTDAFACGTSYYGVAELLRFVHDTHDFESHYIDGLVGPLPQARELYQQRAPLSHVADLSCPVLLIQGDQDVIVPPSQAEMFAAALAEKGIPHAYLLFEGEQHGLRKAESIIAAAEAELSFYGQVMGFVPPGVPRIELTTG